MTAKQLLGDHELLPGNRWSMRRLLALLIVASTLPLAALLAIQVQHEWQSHVEDARALVQGLATVTANEAAESLKEIERTLVLLAKRSQVRALDVADCDPLIGDIRALQPNIANAASLDRAGNVVCSSVPASVGPLPNFGDMPWFRRLKEGKPTVISSPGWGPVTKRWISFAGAPIHDASGAFAGAVVMTIDLTGFQPMVHAALPEDAVVGIIDREGVVVARTSSIAMPIGRNVKDSAFGRAVLAGRRNTEAIVGNDGIERLYAYQPVADTDWTVAAGVPTRIVYSPLRGSAWRNGIGLLFVLASTALLAFAVYRRIARPLTGLRDASRAIAQGSVHQRAPANGPRELTEMARSFNLMMDRIVETEHAAREHQDHYRRLFLASPEAICLVQDDLIVMVNPAATRLFGGEGDMRGRDATDLVHPRDRADAQRRTRRVLDGRSELETDEIEILRADGSGAAAALTLLPFSYQGKPAALAMIDDISEQRRLEAEVQARRHEMERLVNQQVAVHTALAVAHELNQPLGAVSAYCEAALLMLEGGNPSPENLRQALQRGVEQAHRAGSSLHELIDFLHGEEAPVAPFDLAAAIRQATQLVCRQGGDKPEVSVHVDKDLPHVLGSSVQVTKVLVNLLHNAIEATSSTTNRAISISAKATPAGDMAQVSVRDSGPGMSAEAAQQIFTPFFSSKPGGMGLGLVISRALITAQGGQLWWDPSSVDSGAVFHFTVPLAT